MQSNEKCLHDKDFVDCEEHSCMQQWTHCQHGIQFTTDCLLCAEEQQETLNTVLHLVGEGNMRRGQQRMLRALEPGVTVKQAQAQVKEFQVKILPPDLTFAQQFGKLLEEVAETYQAFTRHDQVEVVDGLGDAFYVLLGLANLYGVDLGRSFEEIHSSNMTKTRDGSLSPKGEGFVRPDLRILTKDLSGTDPEDTVVLPPHVHPDDELPF